ncbi:MAG: nucleotidyltransferase domain-containing protein [Nanoarchaeota archaeon]|nr:nucleotidyltransferase domain-containing protein [Nanoarchaeota archaeon]MBU1632620.1 nucleotidyltransferase domain-containing protein [Nanoarchaeota archaeon]MBU1876557.1 nucleotidyltransferase domain-containing protein [Nanoarchaeota archaeon]
MKSRDIKTEVKKYFFLYPTAKLRVRQIEREVKVPLPSAIRYSKELENENILKSTIVAGMKLYSADRTSQNFLLEKKLFNIHSLFSSELVSFFINELSNPTIVVFGSYSRGEDIENSDIDIYVETQSKNKLDLSKFEKKLKRKIQVFRYKNINKVENKSLANNIINGILLNGFVGVFK